MSFWAFIIPILVQLLQAFLTALFKKANTTSQIARGTLSVPRLSDSRAEFVASMKFRFWLGPYRHQWAGALYDRVQARMGHIVVAGPNLSKTVEFATDGLEKLTPEDLAMKNLGAGAHNFKVVPIGIVQGGSATYSLDEISGVVNYRASIRVGKWFFSKTYEYSGSYDVLPEYLDPTKIVLGRAVHIGALKMKVTKVGPTSAVMAVSIDGQSAAGTAIVATNKPTLELLSLDATISASGFTISLSVLPV